ncbi:MAG TPA: hypothetical protein VNL70_11110 [Tepidisphaeraceae bacterium]|nr:hypothetical protein [Tepidisphaeraceae bacterium]
MRSGQVQGAPLPTPVPGRNPRTAPPCLEPLEARRLLSDSSICGIVFNDVDGDGQIDSGESALAGFRVFVDLNENGAFESNEPAAISDADGAYTIAELSAATYALTVADQDLWVEPPARQIAVPEATAVSGVFCGVRTAVEQTTSLSRGPTTLVNTFTANAQHSPDVAVDADGDWVVVWASYLQDLSGDGIYAQRFDSSGQALGGELRVNTAVNGSQTAPAVAIDADGDFVVVWQSGPGQDSSGYGIYGQRYTAAGLAVGGEFRINSFTDGDQYAPAVAMDAAGNFVVAWTSSLQDGSVAGIYAQRYDASGTPLGSEFRVNSTTGGYQYAPSVGMDPDGSGFVIAWVSDGQDGSDAGIFAQRYDAGGVPAGEEFLVNSFTSGTQDAPSAAMDAQGNFIIVWQSAGMHDGSGYGVYAQRYNAQGLPQGGEFRVNSFTTGSQYEPDVAIDADGDFVITWTSRGPNGSRYGIYAQRYNAAGLPMDSEFAVGSLSLHDQLQAAIANDADGEFIIAWQSELDDGSSWGVYAQRYGSPVAYAAVVYNNSVFDGNDPAANPADDAAIAPDKRPLSPGHKAGFVNYTSYSKGLNAIVIDLRDNTAPPEPGQFIFRVGNSDNYHDWSQATELPTISYRAGGGVGASNRVTLVWADNAIQKTWLAITIRADSITGLSREQTLVFGNAIGETGDSPSDAMVNSADEVLTASNATATASITNRYDHNRDGVVDQADEELIGPHHTTSEDALRLIDLAALPPSGSDLAAGAAKRRLGLRLGLIRLADSLFGSAPDEGLFAAS